MKVLATAVGMIGGLFVGYLIAAPIAMTRIPLAAFAWLWCVATGAIGAILGFASSVVIERWKDRPTRLGL